jgi:hypothetical protein
MTLPKRNERDYLEIKESAGGFSLFVRQEHASELSALLSQYGITYERKKSMAPGGDELFFSDVTLKPKVAVVLESYKNVKGS